MPRSAAHWHAFHLWCSVFLCLVVIVFFRSVFRRASGMHTGPNDWCNQELLPEVPTPQPDMSPAPKSSAGCPSLDPQPVPGQGLSSDWNGLWDLTFYPSAPTGPEFLCPRKNICPVESALMWSYSKSNWWIKADVVAEDSFVYFAGRVFKSFKSRYPIKALLCLPCHLKSNAFKKHQIKSPHLQAEEVEVGDVSRMLELGM